MPSLARRTDAGQARTQKSTDPVQVGVLCVVDKNVCKTRREKGRANVHDGFLVRRTTSFVVKVYFDLAASAAENAACFLRIGGLLGCSGPRVHLYATP